MRKTPELEYLSASGTQAPLRNRPQPQQRHRRPAPEDTLDSKTHLSLASPRGRTLMRLRLLPQFLLLVG